MWGDGLTGRRRTQGRRAFEGRTRLVFVCLCAVLLALVAASLCMGSLPIPLASVVKVLAGRDRTGTYSQVIMAIRLPRLIAAALLGGALALAGLLLQVFFNNPIAGPYVLGISSGAKLAVALLMVSAAGVTGVLSSWMLVLAAFVGSLAAVAAVLVVARRVRSAGMLVVAGVMIGYLCSAATDVLVTFASDAHIINLRNWSMGSFSGISWSDLGVLVPLVLGASACVFAMAKPLGAYQLGERYAQSAGVDVRRFRVRLIVLSSLLAACVTAFAGPISFVGIAVPHLTKRLMGTSRPLLVLPACFLGGAIFCLACDLVARVAFAPTEVAVSTVTAIFGAPVVIAMLVRRQQVVG